MRVPLGSLPEYDEEGSKVVISMSKAYVDVVQSVVSDFLGV